ncbi:hypothetical protein HAQ06_25875, partial [Pseudomonas sp. C2L12B]|nr:hypothetical protein [Pseudomonas typographi]MBD1590064.1 hypothetical protein [Pseudomonas typographi]MBD1601696.1 hypothetical protein [Pseudomonas typographi]
PEVLKYSAWKHALANKLDKASQGPTIPLIAVACAVYNLEAQIEGMRGVSDESEGGKWRYRSGNMSAVIDLSAGLGNLSKALLGNNKSWIKLINEPHIKISQIKYLKPWADNLRIQTGNPNLSFLRGFSGIAMGITTAITLWDAERAWHQGDHDVAFAYGIAATGGAAWTAYALGMSINPVVLIVGAALFIIGSIVAGWLVDSDIETLLKNGPFGQNHRNANVPGKALGYDPRFLHLRDPSAAYQQLLGALAKPVIKAQRFSDWWAHASDTLRHRISVIDQQRGPINRWGECSRPSAQRFEPYDWVVSVHSPLLSMFEENLFQFYAREDFAVLHHSGAFNAERVERREIAEPKLAAYRLDNSTLMYVLPTQFPVHPQTPRDRFDKTITHRLKIFGQFRLFMDIERSQTLVLPQPGPKVWKPYSSEFHSRPPLNPREGNAPYWHIETLELGA